MHVHFLPVGIRNPFVVPLSIVVDLSVSLLHVDISSLAYLVHDLQSRRWCKTNVLGEGFEQHIVHGVIHSACLGCKGISTARVEIRVDEIQVVNF